MYKNPKPLYAQQKPHSDQNTGSRQTPRADEHYATWDTYVSALSEPAIIHPDERSGLDALPIRYPRLFMGEPLPWGLQIGPG